MRSDEIQSGSLEEMPIQDLINFLKKKKQMSTMTLNSTMKKREDFFYDLKEDKFCYCSEASYGDMVFCENLYCEREWFHLNCIKETNLP